MPPSFYAVDPRLVDGTPLTLQPPQEPSTTSTTTTTPQQPPIVIWRLTLTPCQEQLTVPLESQEVLSSLDSLYPQLSTRCKSGPTFDRLQTCLANHETFTLFLATTTTTTTSPTSLPKITKIVGALTLVTLKLLMKSCAHIEDVVVDGSCRGQGLGKGLMRRALDEAVHAHGCVMVDLTSNPNRVEARTLYQSLGFELRDTGVFRYMVPQ